MSKCRGYQIKPKETFCYTLWKRFKLDFNLSKDLLKFLTKNKNQKVNSNKNTN